MSRTCRPRLNAGRNAELPTKVNSKASSALIKRCRATRKEAVAVDECPQRYTSTGIFECVRILAKPLSQTSLGMVDAASDAKRRRWLDRMRDYGRRLV